MRGRSVAGTYVTSIETFPDGVWGATVCVRTPRGLLLVGVFAGSRRFVERAAGDALLLPLEELDEVFHPRSGSFLKAGYKPLRRCPKGKPSGVYRKSNG